MTMVDGRRTQHPRPAPASWQRRGAWGLLIAGGLVALTGATAAHWPDGALVGTFGRMLDSLAPQLLALGAGLALLSLLTSSLPYRRPRYRGQHTLRGLGLLLLLGTGLAAAQILAVPGAALPGSADRTAAGPERSLEVLWFNLLYDNTAPPERLAAAVETSGADLVMLAEATPIRPVLVRLARTYPYQTQCTEKLCEVVVLSKTPFAGGRVDQPPMTRRQRLAAFGMQPADQNGQGLPLSVVAVQMPKPWFYGYVDTDRWFLRDRVQARPGPVLVAGDFNAAPWSRSLARILEETGLAAPHHPVPTWPVWAGSFGVPIDNLLVGGGARLEDLRPWGDDLGSNHRGLRARVLWPG